MTNYNQFNSIFRCFWKKSIQISILGLSVFSFTLQPTALAQNQTPFNISVYNNVINGDDSSQPIMGDTSKRNVIFGKGGDDRIIAGPNGDLIFGNQGRDALYGGKGGNTPDFIFGGKGLDYLYGGTGGSTIYTDLDGALVWGGSGVNNIYAMPVNRPNDPVYPMTYVKTGTQVDNVFVELVDPNEKNGMLFLHNAKNASDNLTFDNRYTLQNSCFIDTNQNNQNYRWNFHVLNVNSTGQKIGVWVLGNFNSPKFAPVSIRNYNAPISTVNPNVANANQDAVNLTNEFKIPVFDMNNAMNTDMIVNACNNSKNNQNNSSGNSRNISQNATLTSSILTSRKTIGRSSLGRGDLLATLSYENNNRRLSWEADLSTGGCKNIERSYAINQNGKLVIIIQRENPQGRSCTADYGEFLYKNSEITNLSSDFVRNAVSSNNFEIQEQVENFSQGRNSQNNSSYWR